MVGSQILDQKRLLELFLVHGFISIVNSFNFLKSLHGLRKRLTVTMYHCWLIALMLLHISCDHPAKRVSCSSESSYCKGPEGSPKGIFERLLGVELQLQPADLVCVIDESLQDSHLLFLLVLLFLGLFFFRRTHSMRYFDNRQLVDNFGILAGCRRPPLISGNPRLAALLDTMTHLLVDRRKFSREKRFAFTDLFSTSSLRWLFYVYKDAGIQIG